jgi:phosphatidylinositol glycan class B
MKAIFQSAYSKYFIYGLLINIIAAWFSVGYHHPDEHFQILEFCNYKLGNSPVADLPWEFAAKIRPGLQPFITYCFISVFNSIGIYNPFVITFLFRLLIGFLGWMAVCKLVMLLLPDFLSERSKKLFVLLSFFLWFVPYLNVRFSSENTATISFLYAIYLLLKLYSTNFKKISSFFIIGFLLAFSFFFRFQMAFAIVGLIVWLLLIHKISWLNWLSLFLSGVCGALICIYLDKWLYGTWTFTPYNYYVANIVQHVAANFGTDPWWHYVVLFITAAIPPLSIGLLYFFGAGIYSKPKSVFVFILVAFVIGHSLIGHKEMRFLFPMWFAFVYLTAIGIDFCILKYKSNKFFTYTFKCLIVLNFGALLYRTIAPAQEAIPCFSFANEQFKQPTTIVCIEEPLYSLAGLKANFYKPKNIEEIVLKGENGLNDFLSTNNQDSVIVFKKAASLNNVPANYTSKRIYCMFPEWVLKFNINNWEDRANIWSIHVLYKKK